MLKSLKGIIEPEKPSVCLAHCAKVVLYMQGRFQLHPVIHHFNTSGMRNW